MSSSSFGTKKIKTICQRSAQTVLIMSLCLMLSGCALWRWTTSKGMVQPTIEVVGLSLPESNQQGLRVQCLAILSNTNDFELPVTEVAYTLTVGEHRYQATVVPNVTIPANHQIPLVLKAVLPIDRQAMEGQAYRLTGQFKLLPPVGIHQLATEIGLKKPRVKFDHQGRVATQ